MRILVVEDDRALCEAIVYWLSARHYETDCCHDGLEARFYQEEGCFDCMLLDCMLPGLDGISLLKKMRREGDRTPVILITALGTLSDKLTGLNCGADDYLVKPFDLEELEARIRSVTRRHYGADTDMSLHFSDLSYDPERLFLTGPAGSLTLAKKEGKVLETLLQNTGQTLSREMILSRVWGLDSDVELSNLDNYIYFLRRRLNTLKSTVRIVNVWGVGYRMTKGD